MNRTHGPRAHPSWTHRRNKARLPMLRMVAHAVPAFIEMAPHLWLRFKKWAWRPVRLPSSWPRSSSDQEIHQRIQQAIDQARPSAMALNQRLVIQYSDRRLLAHLIRVLHSHPTEFRPVLQEVRIVQKEGGEPCGHQTVLHKHGFVVAVIEPERTDPVQVGIGSRD